MTSYTFKGYYVGVASKDIFAGEITHLESGLLVGVQEMSQSRFHDVVLGKAGEDGFHFYRIPTDTDEFMVDLYSFRREITTGQFVGVWGPMCFDTYTSLMDIPEISSSLSMPVAAAKSRLSTLSLDALLHPELIGRIRAEGYLASISLEKK